MDFTKLLYAAQIRAIAIELMDADAKKAPPQEREAVIAAQDPDAYIKRAHNQVLRAAAFLETLQPS